MWPVLLIALASTAATPRTDIPPTARERATDYRSGGAAPADRSRFESEEALRHFLLGRWLEQSGDLRGALSEYYRSLALDPSGTTILLRVSEAAARAGEAQRSLEFADRALALEPEDGRALWLKGAALFNLGRNAEAVPALEAAVRADSTRADYWKALARAAEAVDRVDLVERSYRHAVAIDEDDAESWFQLAAALGRLARFPEADVALARSLELNPIRPGAFFMRAWIREGNGKVDEAIELYREHLRIHDRDFVTRRRLVGLLAARGRKPEAYAEAKAIAAARPDDAETRLVEADLAYDVGKPAEGARAIAQARRAAPADPDLLLRAAVVLTRHGHGRDAARLGDEWASTHPDDPRSPLLPARTYAVAGLYDSAAVRARRVVEATPDSLTPRRLLARVLQDARRWSEAEREWREVARRTPNEPGALLDIAFCREQAGDVRGAESAGRDALRIDPELPSALNFLGYLLADHGGDLAEAEQLIQKAVTREPDNGAFVDSFGWVLFRLGRLEEARRQLERALALTGGDPVIHEHLGDVYAALRLLDLAKAQYRLSLAEGDPNPRVRGKLDALR